MCATKSTDSGELPYIFKDLKRHFDPYLRAGGDQRQSLALAAARPRWFDLTECINLMVLESQLPHKIANLLFTITNYHDKLIFL